MLQYLTLKNPENVSLHGSFMDQEKIALQSWQGHTESSKIGDQIKYTWALHFSKC